MQWTKWVLDELDIYLQSVETKSANASYDLEKMKKLFIKFYIVHVQLVLELHLQPKIISKH